MFFAITSSKPQCQSLCCAIGLDLKRECFSHGQLYVTMSKATYPSNIYLSKKNATITKSQTESTRLYCPQIRKTYNTFEFIWKSVCRFFYFSVPYSCRKWILFDYKFMIHRTNNIYFTAVNVLHLLPYNRSDIQIWILWGIYLYTW